MLPSSPPPDTGYLWPRKANKNSDFSVTQLLLSNKFTNSTNCFLCYFMIGMALSSYLIFVQSNTPSMLLVFAPSSPFQITKSVVEFVAILVVYFMFGGRLPWEKSICYQDVYAKRSGKHLMTELDSDVSRPFLSMSLQYATNNTSIVPRRSTTAYSALVRNFVVRKLWNNFPLFCSIRFSHDVDLLYRLTSWLGWSVRPTARSTQLTLSQSW